VWYSFGEIEICSIFASPNERTGASKEGKKREIIENIV